MSDQEPTVVTAYEQTTAVMHGAMPVTEMVNFFDRSFRRIPEVVGEQGVEIVGPAFARFHQPPTDTVDLEVGFATATPITDVGEVVAGSLPGGRVARLVHHGPYEQLGSSWARLQSWLYDNGITPGDAMWELYVTEPSPDMDPNDLRTELNWLVET